MIWFLWVLCQPIFFNSTNGKQLSKGLSASFPIWITIREYVCYPHSLSGSHFAHGHRQQHRSKWEKYLGWCSETHSLLSQQFLHGITVQSLQWTHCWLKAYTCGIGWSILKLQFSSQETQSFYQLISAHKTPGTCACHGDINLQQSKKCLVNFSADIANHNWCNWDKNRALWEPKLTLIQKCLAFLPHHCCIWHRQSMHVIEIFLVNVPQEQELLKTKDHGNNHTVDPLGLGRKSLFPPAWQGPTHNSTAIWACGEKGEDAAPREQRVRNSLSKTCFLCTVKLQSSREQGAGYIVQAVAGLLGFGK